MRQSQIFTKARKESPKDEVSKNAELLIRAGYIHKEMAGVYSFLPLGLRTLNKIVEIIRKEMVAIGGQEISMTALQNPEPWQSSKRWDDSVMDVWFKTNLKGGGELGLAPTHEEPLTNIVSQHVRSYRDLPISIFQFQNKFRNELRAKSGIMRGREFLMKDLYSFTKDEAELDVFYKKAAEAYKNVWDKLGIGDKTYFTVASGGAFSKWSHEFQTVCDAGEDVIYVDEEKNIAVNKEVLNTDAVEESGLNREKLVEKKSIEVGNIFKLGTRFSESIGLNFTDEEGNSKPVVMGSYGIGPSRVMGTLVELFADDKGLVWPDSVAPFKVHLVYIQSENKDTKDKAEELYKILTDNGVEVLFDDRDLRAGEKFAESDLIGIPKRVVISDRALESGEYECVSRKDGLVMKSNFDQLIKELSS